MEIKMVYLIGMDGVLCDNPVYAKYGKYMTLAEYNNTLYLCRPRQEMIKVFNQLFERENTKVFLLTARQNQATRTTLDWLDKHTKVGDRLTTENVLFRAEDDFRSAVKFKENFLDYAYYTMSTMITHDRDVVQIAAYENDEDARAMYRKHDIFLIPTPTETVL